MDKKIELRIREAIKEMAVKKTDMALAVGMPIRSFHRAWEKWDFTLSQTARIAEMAGVHIFALPDEDTLTGMLKNLGV